MRRTSQRSIRRKSRTNWSLIQISFRRMSIGLWWKSSKEIGKKEKRTNKNCWTKWKKTSYRKKRNKNLRVREETSRPKKKGGCRLNKVRRKRRKCTKEYSNRKKKRRDFTTRWKRRSFCTRSCKRDTKAKWWCRRWRRKRKSWRKFGELATPSISSKSATTKGITSPQGTTKATRSPNSKRNGFTARPKRAREWPSSWKTRKNRRATNSPKGGANTMSKKQRKMSTWLTWSKTLRPEWTNGRKPNSKRGSKLWRRNSRRSSQRWTKMIWASDTWKRPRGKRDKLRRSRARRIGVIPKRATYRWPRKTRTQISD